MSPDEVRRLVEAATQPLREQLVKADARNEAGKILSGVSLPQAAKDRLTESALANVPRTADGSMDGAKFRESLLVEAKKEGEYLAALTGSGRVQGLGVAPAAQVQLTEAEQRAQEKRELEDATRVFESLGMPKSAAEKAAQWGGQHA